jgi:hypothetical protein
VLSSPRVTSIATNYYKIEAEAVEVLVTGVRRRREEECKQKGKHGGSEAVEVHRVHHSITGSHMEFSFFLDRGQEEDLYSSIACKKKR